MVNTEVMAGSRVFLTSRTLTTRDMLFSFALAVAVRLTGSNTDVFSVAAGAGVVVFVAIAGGEIVVDRKMSRKFGNQMFSKFLFTGRMVVFGLWSNIKYASVVKSLYFCMSGVFFLVLILIIMFDGVVVGKICFDLF